MRERIAFILPFLQIIIACYTLWRIDNPPEHFCVPTTPNFTFRCFQQ
jgi:hypothetical protein